jgi:hypothetical protein
VSEKRGKGREIKKRREMKLSGDNRMIRFDVFDEKKYKL